MEWITLDEVKHHLRYDDDANDTILTVYMRAANSAINRYIDADAPESAADDIKAAALLLVGYFDQHRNADKDTPTNGNYLPQPVIALLYPYHTPVVT